MCMCLSNRRAHQSLTPTVDPRSSNTQLSSLHQCKVLQPVNMKGSYSHSMHFVMYVVDINSNTMTMIADHPDGQMLKRLHRFCDVAVSGLAVRHNHHTGLLIVRPQSWFLKRWATKTLFLLSKIYFCFVNLLITLFQFLNGGDYLKK